MGNVETIIWDWNGTLFNDLDICLKSINQLLHDRQLPLLTKEKYLNVFDFPVQDYYRRVGFNFETEPFEIPALQFTELYFSNIQLACLHHQANEVLQYFSESGIRQLVLSAAEQTKLIGLLDTYHLSQYFEMISGLQHDFATSKVEQGIEMLKLLNATPENVCLIGDTTHDFEVAKAIGCQCILIANGHHPYEKLCTTDAMVIHGLGELIDLFKK